MPHPPPLLGLRHIALFVKQYAACKDFYTQQLGMKIVWEPDENNVYLASLQDNLALHRAPPEFTPAKNQHLDHLGFLLASKADVDAWYTHLAAEKVTILAKPKDHRDGTRSFYCADPDGNAIQLIYWP